MDMRERDTHNAIKGECLEEGRSTELVSKQVFGSCQPQNVRRVFACDSHSSIYLFILVTETFPEHMSQIRGS
jgi:hypothetical protein